ncbi:MAG: hypothetical protein ABEN55_14270, partial [Bradymonadaceae bacterium]
SWNISALAGASYMFSPKVGGFIEGGLYNQNITLKASGDVQGTEVTSTTTGAFSQFGVLAGITIGL